MRTNGERQVATDIEGIRADHRMRYEWAAEQLGSKDLVLDAACGVGYGTHTLAQRARHVVGIDFDEEAIAFANAHWKAENAEFRRDNLHFLELEPGQKFDAVVAFEIIEHLVRPDLFLERLKSYITKKTKIFVSSPNESEVQHTVELNPFHIQHYTPDSFESLMNDCGYNVIKVMSQDADEIYDGNTGRTIIFQCTLYNKVKSKVLDAGAAKAALSATERQMSLRSHTIRRLQSRIRVREEQQADIVGAVGEILDKELRQNVEKIVTDAESKRKKLAVFVQMTINEAIGKILEIERGKNEKSEDQLLSLASRLEEANVAMTAALESRMDSLTNVMTGEILKAAEQSLDAGEMRDAFEKIESTQNEMISQMRGIADDLPRSIPDILKSVNEGYFADNIAQTRQIVEQQGAQLWDSLDARLDILREASNGYFADTTRRTQEAVKQQGAQLLEVLGTRLNLLREASSGYFADTTRHTKEALAQQGAELLAELDARIELLKEASSGYFADTTRRTRKVVEQQGTQLLEALDTRIGLLKEANSGHFADTTRQTQEAVEQQGAQLLEAVDARIDLLKEASSGHFADTTRQTQEAVELHGAQLLEALDARIDLLKEASSGYFADTARQTREAVERHGAQLLEVLDTRIDLLKKASDERVVESAIHMREAVEQQGAHLLAEIGSKITALKDVNDGYAAESARITRDIVASRSDKLAEDLGSRIDLMKDEVSSRIFSHHDDGLQNNLITIKNELIEHKSFVVESLDNRLADLKASAFSDGAERNELRRIAAAASEREKFVLFEIRRLEADGENIRSSMAEEKSRASELDLHNKALSAKINQLSHAMTSQNFEISKRKAMVDQLTSKLQVTEEANIKLQKANVALNGTIATVEAKKENITERFKSLTKDFGAINEALAKEVKKTLHFQDESVKAKERLIWFTKENGRLSKELAKEVDQRSRLQDEHGKAGERLLWLTKENGRLAEELGKEVDKRTKIEGEHAKLQEEYTKASEKLLWFTRENERLNDIVVSIEEKYLKQRDASLMQEAQIVSLEQELGRLKSQEARRLRRFNPQRPTLYGLFRIMVHHGFFVSMIMRAPFLSGVDLIKYFKAKK